MEIYFKIKDHIYGALFNSMIVVLKIKRPIRTLKEKNLPEFVALWNQEYLLLTSSKFKMTLEKAKKGFSAKMFDYYGVCHNDKLIGFMLLKEDKDLWIKHILIDKDFRKRGLGNIFLKKADQITKKKKMKLKTEVIKENQEAKKFFLKNRFKIIKFDEKENQYILEKNCGR